MQLLNVRLKAKKLFSSFSSNSSIYATVHPSIRSHFLMQDQELCGDTMDGMSLWPASELKSLSKNDVELPFLAFMALVVRDRLLKTV